MGFSAMAMMRLNSQVRQFYGFAHGERVFGRPPKMPIGAVCNPHFLDFTSPIASPTAKSHHLLGASHQIRQPSLTAGSSGKLNSASRKRIRESKMGKCLGRSAFFLRQIGKQKAKGDG